MADELSVPDARNLPRNEQLADGNASMTMRYALYVAVKIPFNEIVLVPANVAVAPDKLDEPPVAAIEVGVTFIKPPKGLAAAKVKLSLSDAAVNTSPLVYVVNGIVPTLR